MRFWSRTLSGRLCLTEQTLSKDKSPLSLKNQDFTNVEIGIETCLIPALIMVLKHGDWFHFFMKG